MDGNIPQVQGLIEAAKEGEGIIRYMVITKHGWLWTYHKGDIVEFYGTTSTGECRSKELADAIRARCKQTTNEP